MICKVEILAFIFIAATLLAGCSKRPKGILSEDEMVSLMADIQIAEAMQESGKSIDGNGRMDRELLGRGVLMAHGVSMAEMDSTLAWYGRNMDEYSKLYKKVDEELKRRQTRYARAAGESSQEGPSSDLWPYGRHLVLSDKSLTDGIVAILPASELTPGDKLTWKMRTMGAGMRDIMLGVDYEDGSTSIVKSTANNSFEKWVEVSLQTDTLLAVDGIFAVMKTESNDKRVYVDSIQLIHQPLNRDEYHKINYQRRIGAPAARKTILPSDSVANSSRVPDSITSNPSASTGKSLALKTRL